MLLVTKGDIGHEWRVAECQRRRQDAYGVKIITQCPVATAQSLPLLVFTQTVDATLRELLLRWNRFFRRIYGNSFQTWLRQILGLTEADQTVAFQGTQYLCTCGSLVAKRTCEVGVHLRFIRRVLCLCARFLCLWHAR